MATDLKLQVQLGLADKILGPLKRVRKGAGDLGKELSATRDQVKALQAQQGDVAGYRKANIEIIKQGRQLKHLGATQTHYTSELERQRTAHTNLTANLRTAKSQYNKLAKALIDGKGKSAEFHRELEKAQIKLLSSQQAFTRSQKSISTYSDRLRHAKERHGQLSQAQRNSQARLDGLKVKLDAAGISTDKLSHKAREQRDELKKLNGVYDQHKDRLKQVNDLQKRNAALNAAHGKSMAHAAMIGGGGYAMLSAGRTATNSLLKPITAYSQFEDAMAGVAKQVEGARDANGQLTPTYYQMADAIKAMSERIPMATTEIAALVEGGARMGIQGKDNLLAFAEVAANAATAFEIPADQLGENLARIADLYKLPIKNVSQLGDAINYLDDNAKSKGADIIDVLQRTAGITAQVGMTYKDAAALGSTFLTIGSTAETAGSATNAMIRELAIATQQPKRFQKGLKTLGIEAQSLQDDMSTNATGTIQRVLEAINKLPKKQQIGVTTQLFGKEYGKDAAKLASNIGEYRRQLELANSAAGKGSMQREADIKAQLLSARWQTTQNRLFNGMASAGETLKPVLIDLMNTASRFLEVISGWVKENPALAAGILKTALGLTMLATVLGGAAIALAGFMAPFSILNFVIAKFMLNSGGASLVLGKLFPIITSLAKTALPMLGSAIMLVGRAMLLNPIGLAITGLAVSALLIYKYWEPIKKFFTGLWSEIKAGFSGGLSGIIGLLYNFSPIGMFYRAWAAVLNYFGAELPSKFTDFGIGIIRALINGITSMFPSFGEAIDSITSRLPDGVKNVLGISATLAPAASKGTSAPLRTVKSPPLVRRAHGRESAASPIAINVTAGPGMDEQSLARLVAAEVAKVQRASQVRGRSSLTDQE